MGTEETLGSFSCDGRRTSILSVPFRVEWWRPVTLDGEETRYRVSFKGRVRNQRTGRILKPSPNTQGYQCVCLYHGGRKRTVPVHQLVAAAWCDFGEWLDARPAPEVHHVNARKQDNASRNLRWVTRQANIRAAVEDGLIDGRGERNGRAKLTDADVREIRQQAAQGRSHGAIAREWDLARPTVSQIVSGARWGHVALELDPLPRPKCHSLESGAVPVSD